MIQQEYPDFQRLDDAKNDTSKAWKVPGFKVKYTIFICCMLICNWNFWKSSKKIDLIAASFKYFREQ